jgi:Acetyltransferase (GNAT) domain
MNLRESGHRLTEETHLIGPDDPEWDKWVKKAPHDFYHTAAYHAFSERAGEGRACMVVHGNDRQFMAWPYLVRPAGSGDVDATSVYGYTGPTGLGLDDIEFRHRSWGALRRVWAEQGLVSLFTRFHPLLENDLYCADLPGASEVAGGEVLTLGLTVMIQLSPDRDARRMSYDQVLRQQIKRAEREGVMVAEDTGWHDYAAFGRLYRSTMERNSASQGYMFSDQYFDRLRDALQNCGHLAVARVGDEVAGIMLFTVTGTIAQAHLTGSDPRFMALSPTKVLIDHVAEICARRGATVLHLGAGRGGLEDSLFQFKSRFSKLRGRFTVGRWILDATRYDALVRQSGVDPAGEGIFFPVYRTVRSEEA